MRIQATLEVYNDVDQDQPVLLWADLEGYEGADIVTIQVGSEVAEVSASDLHSALGRCSGRVTGDPE